MNGAMARENQVVVALKPRRILQSGMAFQAVSKLSVAVGR